MLAATSTCRPSAVTAGSPDRSRARASRPASSRARASWAAIASAPGATSTVPASPSTISVRPRRDGQDRRPEARDRRDAEPAGDDRRVRGGAAGRRGQGPHPRRVELGHLRGAEVVGDQHGGLAALGLGAAAEPPDHPPPQVAQVGGAGAQVLVAQAVVAGCGGLDGVVPRPGGGAPRVDRRLRRPHQLVVGQGQDLGVEDVGGLGGGGPPEGGEIVPHGRERRAERGPLRARVAGRLGRGRAAGAADRPRGPDRPPGGRGHALQAAAVRRGRRRGGRRCGRRAVVLRCADQGGDGPRRLGGARDRAPPRGRGGPRGRRARRAR